MRGRRTPTACSAATQSHKVRRRVFCKHYPLCLDQAITSNWDSFSCESCRGYECERREPSEWTEDSTRCSALIYFVTFSKLKLQVYNANATYGLRHRPRSARTA